MPLDGAGAAFFGSVGLYLGRQSLSPWEMIPEEACRYIEQVGSFLRDGSASDDGLAYPTGLHISGSEPLAQLADLEMLIDRAARFGLPTEIVTSARWDHAETDKIAERVFSRLRLLTIHTSSREIDEFGFAALQCLLQAARKFQVSMQIIVGVGPGNSFPRELLGLEVVNSETSVFRIQPSSIGTLDKSDESRWPPGFLMATPPRYARCAELMAFVIGPGGDVYPCLASVGFAQLRLGTLRTQSVAEIIQRATARPTLRRLRDEGPYFLYEPWRAAQNPESLPSGYLSSCDFHRRTLLTSED